MAIDLAPRTPQSAPSLRPNSVRPDINVTPLVDVVLVLLIIFMVVTPQMEAGEQVELPTIFNPDPEAKSRIDPLVVTVTASGRMLLDKLELTDDSQLASRLQTEHATSPSRRVVVKADRNLPFGRMDRLMKVVQDTGFAGVSLVVGDKPPVASRGH